MVSIRENAFSGCENIRLTKLPDKLTEIEDYTFDKCYNLALTELPNGIISIGEYAFRGCEKLAVIKLPDGLTDIKAGTFDNCKNLAITELPSGVNFIGTRAFSYCDSLTKLTFNDKIAPVIEDAAFAGCRNLTIYIPAGATGYTAENNWPVELIAHPITVQDDGNGTASASYSMAKSGTEIILNANPNKGYQLKKWEVVSDNVTVVDNKFTMPMEDVIVKAIFEESSTSGEVASGTFGENDCLSWSLDENEVLTVTGIDDMPYCEWNCGDWEENIDQIPWDGYKDQIIEIVIDGGITTIPIGVFGDYLNLKTVTLSNKIIALSSGAFSGCINLETINLPDTITFIGNSTFANCSNLILTELPSNLQSLGNAFGRTFENCTKISLTSLPDTLTYIDEYSFSGCVNLTLMKLPNGIKDIGEGAFSGCKNLELTELPSNLGSIGKEAFKGCANLALSRLPARVNLVGEYAFQDCTNLTMMKLPGDLATIETGIFKGCNNLSFVELPDGLRYIEGEAFEDCKNLSALEIPSSLLLLGQNAFNGCSSLTSLELPKNLDSIETGAFDGCTNLQELTFDGKVAPLIDVNMFDDCENLTIYIPAGAVGYTKENHWPEELIAHPITVQDDGHGTASVSRTGAKAGTEIILIAKPDEGYQFDKWEVVSGGITIKDDTFTMPMGDVTVKARFEKASDQEQEKDQYRTLHFDTNGGSSLGFVMEKEGTLVSLTYYIPVRTGYQFTGWYADAKLTKKITSIRLDENKIVYAGWEKAETDTREEQEISMTNPLQVRDLKNGTRTTSSKACTLKLGFKVNDPDLELAYTTSDPSVATVKDGKITYQGIGTCTITVTAGETDKCKEASLTITVKVGSLGTPSFTPTVSSKTAAKTFTVTSSTVRGVDGWEVQYSIRNNFWKPVTKDFPEAGTKLYRETCTTMQSNRTYYIHVRGYQMIDGEKIYSNWSPVKTVVTK